MNCQVCLDTAIERGLAFLDRAAKRPRLWFPEVTATIVVQMRRLHVSRQHQGGEK